MVNAQRSRWRRPLREDPHEQIEGLDRPDDPQRQVDDADELERVLRQLSARQRTVVTMRYYDDLSEAQTAKALSCSVGTIKSQTSRGIDRLRRLLEVTGPAAGIDDPTGEFPALV
jgi:RNA polymerase sigma factor (sigma-70 family)